MDKVIDSKQRISMSIKSYRRELASESPRQFAEAYLPHHLRLPSSRMHVDLYGMLHQATQRRGRRIAVAAPRGHAKSTVVSLAYVLWSVLYGHEKFVLIVTATKEQAVQLLKNIKDELQGNERLLMDFPGVCFRPGVRTNVKPWRDNNIALPNGAMIRALGAGQAIRGVKHGPHRPGLIVVDDLENQEICESAEQRQKLRGWFEKTLLKCGDERTNVVVVGTIIHYDSLLANLTNAGKSPGQGAGWENRVYRAVESFSSRTDLWDRWQAIYRGGEEFENTSGPEAAQRYLEQNRVAMLEGTQVLWPEREDYAQLMTIRTREGHVSFQAEKQNDPLTPEECLFKPSTICYWDDPRNGPFADVPELLRSLGHNACIYGACDPSLGLRSGRGDYSAIITVAKDLQKNLLYVIGADIARRSPDETIEQIVRLTGIHNYSELVVEANQFQGLLASQLELRLRQAGRYVRIERVTNTAHKLARIQGLESYISQGILRFSRRHQELLTQIEHYPLGAHDDGPDALEMAVSAAMKQGNTVRVYKLTGV